MATRAGHYRPSFELQLTPKQRQVLSLIERGRTNFEIAQELGLSLEGAKYHVSEILTRLQVDSREEAVRVWREYNSPTARVRRAWAGLSALPCLKIAVVGGAAVAGLAVAVVVVSLARSGGAGPGMTDDGPAVTGATASPTPSPSPATATSSPATAVAQTPTTVPTASATSATTVPASGGSETPVGTTSLRVYFMRGEGVGPSYREVPATQAVARAALEQLLSGPSSAEADSGLTTAIPAGTRLLSISIGDGVATVDLSAEFESGGGTLSVRSRLAQVVYTLTQFPTVDAVSFRIEGQDTTVFTGDGVTIDEPATRAEFEDVTPAILLDSPAQGEIVSGPVRLRGTANTFEATFRIAIMDGDGVVLADEFATATSGSGTRGTFDVTLPVRVSKAGPGVIRVYESSARDGSPIHVVDVPVELAP